MNTPNSRLIFYVDCYIKQLEQKIKSCLENEIMYKSALDHYYTQKAAAQRDRENLLKTAI